MQDIDGYVKKFNQWSKQMVEVKQYKNKFEENNKDIPLPKEVEDFEVNLNVLIKFFWWCIYCLFVWFVVFFKVHGLILL